MQAGYRRWLEEQKYDAGTINAQMYRAGRVEEYHGNLDEQYANDRLASLIDTLRYSTDDKRHNRPNPSKIPFDGDIRNNLASYRNAVERYRKFRMPVAIQRTRQKKTSFVPPLWQRSRKRLASGSVWSATCKRR